MTIDFKSLFDDSGVFWTDTGKHGRKGWVQITCPECGGKTHGGFNIDKHYYNCYKCGFVPMLKILSSYLNMSIPSVKERLKRYTHGEPLETRKYEIDEKKVLELPKSWKPIYGKYSQYLEDRGFDADKLKFEWGLLASDDYWMDGLYKSRVIAPIYRRGKLTSFQGRDITDKHRAKYLPCLKEVEAYPHQLTVYGLDECDEVGVGVEGITDVWRLGKGSVAFFGIDFTKQQIVEIKKSGIKKFFIIFDPEDMAQLKADEIYYQLTGLGVDCEILTLTNDEDPGKMSQEDANHLMRNLGFT